MSLLVAWPGCGFLAWQVRALTGAPAAPIPVPTPQVQPEVDDVEPGSGGPPQWGRLQLSLHYDPRSQEVRPEGLWAGARWWATGERGCRVQGARLTRVPVQEAPG